LSFIVPDYHPFLFFKNGHFNTIWTFLFRKKVALDFERIQFPTFDGDFLDIDQIVTGSSKCAILVHGLEGSSKSSYMLSLAFQLQIVGWDVVLINLRGCSGVPNKLFSAYHSGKTDDLVLVVNHYAKLYSYIVPIGFSLGGNIVLKYAGEAKGDGFNKINSAIGISVPIHLSSTSDKLQRLENRMYSLRFLNSLKLKLKVKLRMFQNLNQDIALNSIRTIRQYDDVYTAPSNGFIDAEDYYTKSSSLSFLERILIPTLIINAQDDPFLTSKCFPKHNIDNNTKIKFLAPKYGGHVGFVAEFGKKLPKHEEWILEYLSQINCK